MSTLLDQANRNMESALIALARFVNENNELLQGLLHDHRYHEERAELANLHHEWSNAALALFNAASGEPAQVETPQEDIRNALAILNNLVPRAMGNQLVMRFPVLDFEAVIKRLWSAVNKLEGSR